MGQQGHAAAVNSAHDIEVTSSRFDKSKKRWRIKVSDLTDLLFSWNDPSVFFYRVENDLCERPLNALQCEDGLG